MRVIYVEAEIRVKTRCVTFTTIKILPQRAPAQCRILKKLAIVCISCEFGHDCVGHCPRTPRIKLKNYPVVKNVDYTEQF